MIDVEIEFSDGVTPRLVNVNGTPWTKTGTHKGTVSGQTAGDGYFQWLVEGDPNTEFTITLTNAVKANDGASTWTRRIPQNLFLNADTNRIKVRQS